MTNADDPKSGGVPSADIRCMDNKFRKLVSLPVPAPRMVRRSTLSAHHEAAGFEGVQLETAEHMAAGAVAGMVADTVMHPLDTISTRLKVQDGVRYSGVLNTGRMIVAEEGHRALFGGLSATVLCALPSAALYFGTYEAVKRIGIQHVPEGAEPLVHLCAGAASELTSSVVAVPFEVIKCRMQLGANPMRSTNGAVPVTGNYSNALQGMRAVVSTQGYQGLYAGFKPCIILDCCFSALQFALYEWSHAHLSKRKNTWWTERQQRANQHERIRDTHDSEERVILTTTTGVNMQRQQSDSAAEFPLRAVGLAVDLSCGAFAGGIGALLTNPLDVVTTRLMTQLPGRGRSYLGTWDCLKNLIKEDGSRALWAGSAARVLSVMPLAALQFSVYEQMKSWLRLQ